VMAEAIYKAPSKLLNPIVSEDFALVATLPHNCSKRVTIQDSERVLVFQSLGRIEPLKTVKKSRRSYRRLDEEPE